MKPVVLIPSYNRPNSRIFEKLKSIGLEVYVFVRKEQYNLYRESLPPEMNLIKLSNVNDIGQTRNAMVRWAKSKGIKWAFMMDDDIQKVEELAQSPSGIFNSKRILSQENAPPRFEKKALQYWYKTAIKYNLSLSSPVYRFNTRGDGGNLLYLNRRPCIQCVLIKIPDILYVGNYGSTREVGAEDYEIQYSLMRMGYNTGVIANIEYDCPSVGSGRGGNNDVETKNLIDRYTEYVRLFYEYVEPLPGLMEVKFTKTGIPSIKFVWKNWGGKIINLDKRKE